MKQILVKVKNRALQAKLLGNKEERKKFSSYKLVMIMYLRQSLVSPHIPISSISIDASNVSKKSELSEIIVDEIDKLNIGPWLNDVNSVKSGRIKKILEYSNKHIDEKIIIFTCFKSCLDIIQYYIKENRDVFRMLSSMNLKKRGKLIEDFKASNDGVLLLTYGLGAEGLNLQFTSIVFLVDFWWNASKTQQAIGRIFRLGQISSEIYIYYFSSNTGIEKILFKKQKAKLQILNELSTGKSTTKIPRISMDKIIRMIEISDNKNMIKSIRYV